MLALEIALGVVTLLGAVGVVGQRGLKLMLRIQATLDDVRDDQLVQRTHLEALRFNSDRTSNRLRDLENFLEKTTEFHRRDYGPPA